MADWFVSSAAYAAIAAFVPSAVYTLGQICKPTAPVLKAQWVFRCTTAGTASTEPVWTTANNSTIATGGATFTNVTGQSTYGWSAAAGDLPTLLGAVGTNRFAAGDRMFVSSDHSETQSTSTVYGATTGASYTGGQILSVNRAGSVPPVAADLLAGATVTVGTGNILLTLDTFFPTYHYGMNYFYTGTNASSIVLSASGTKTGFFDTCQFYINTVTANVRFGSGLISTSSIFFNTTVRFGATSHGLASSSGGQTFDFTWLNTPSAIVGAIIPVTLFFPSSATGPVATLRGVDLSAIAGTLVTNSAIGGGSKFLFDSCRIASAVTRYNATSVVSTRDLVELVNCYDGTNIISESWQACGGVTTEFVITLSGGATDNVGTFSHKMVSNANIDRYANTLNGFWMDANYATTGSARTATVEIISSASLNNNDISLLLEYEGTASSSVASIATSLPANVLTTPSAVTASTATWNSSPATPVRQHLQVTFTPRTAGRLRAQVRLGKASATVWYDPRVVVT